MRKSTAIAVLAVMNLLAAPTLAAEQGRIFRDRSGAVFIYGLQPRQQVQASRDETATKTLTPNACGLLIIRDVTYTIAVENIAVNPAQLPVELLPPCQNGQLAESRLYPFKTPDGIIVLPKPINRWYNVIYLNQRHQRNLKANACGFIRLWGSSLGGKPFLPTINGTIARFTIADLPISEKILCQRGQLYKPANFPPPLAAAMSNQTILDTPPPPQPPTITIGSTGSPWNLASGLEERTITFTIADPDTPFAYLTVATTARNFVPTAFQSATLGGSGANRTLTIKPKDLSATIPLQISVSDGTHTREVNFTIVTQTAPVPVSSQCRNANGTITVKQLSPSVQYALRFISGNTFTLRATSNTQGQVTFTNNYPASTIGYLTLRTSNDPIRSFMPAQLSRC
jgi:hypothetical protein